MKNLKVAAKKVMTALSVIMTLTSMTLSLLQKNSKDLINSHLCLFIFDEINERGHAVLFKYKNKLKIFKYLHQFFKIWKNTYSMVTLTPEMKSRTPKTYTLIPNTGQVNNSVRCFMNWYCIYCHHRRFNPLKSPNKDKFEEK